MGPLSHFGGAQVILISDKHRHWGVEAGDVDLWGRALAVHFLVFLGAEVILLEFLISFSLQEVEDLLGRGRTVVAFFDEVGSGLVIPF
jgi:hypothetical protein